MRGKYFLGRKQAVQGGRKAGIDGHLHDHLDDFRGCLADIERAAAMRLQLAGQARGSVRSAGNVQPRPMRSL